MSWIAAAATLGGGLINHFSNKNATEATQQNLNNQMAMQKQFAKEGIRWRVEDARKAGIHPLYALGANTASYTPSSATFAADNSIGNSLAAAGQDVGRAINSTRTPTERADAFTASMQGLQLENAKLDLETKKVMLASALAKNRDNATPAGPGGLPAPGAPWTLQDDKAGKATPLAAFSTRLGRDAGWSDGQTFEDRWGEWGGGAAGIGTMLADLSQTANIHSGTTLGQLVRKLDDATRIDRYWSYPGYSGRR